MALTETPPLWRPKCYGCGAEILLPVRAGKDNEIQLPPRGPHWCFACKETHGSH